MATSTDRWSIDISDLKKSITEANRQLKTAQAELNNATAGMEKGEKTVDSLTRQIEAQNKIIESEEKKLKALKEELARYNSTLEKGKAEIERLTKEHEKAAREYGENSTQAKKLAKELESAQKAQERTKAAAENLNTRLINQDTALKNAEGAARQLQNSLTALTNSENNAGREAEELDDSLEDTTTGGMSAFAVALGNLASQVITAAIAKLEELVTASIKTGAEFESAVSQIAATMGKTADDTSIVTLADTAKKLGKETQFSASEAAEGLNILAMAGLSVEDQVAGIKTVLDLAAAGGLSLADSANYTTGIVNGFGDSMENAGKYADLIAQGATLAKTNVTQLGSALSGVAAGAASYSQDVDSVTVSLLRMAQQGLTGSEAATALNRAMSDIYSPTPAAKAELEKIGVAAYDAEGKARDFNDVVAELNTALATMSQEEANAAKNAIFTTNGLNVFNKMAVSSAEDVQKFKDGLSSASDGLGAAAQQAETMNDNLQGDVKKMGSAFEAVQIAIYEALGDPLRKVVQNVTDNVLPLLSDIVNGTEGAADKLGTAIGTLLNNIGTEISERMPDIIKTGGNVISSLLIGIIKELPKIVSQLTPILMAVIDTLTENLPAIVDTLAKIIPELVPELLTMAQTLIFSLTDKLPSLLTSWVSALVPLVTDVLTAVFGDPEILTSIVEAVIMMIPDVVEVLLPAVIQIVIALVKALPMVLKTIGAVVKTVFTSLGDIIIEWLTPVGDALNEHLWDVVTNFWAEKIQKYAPWVPIFFENIGKNTVAKIKSIFGGLKTFFGNLWDMIKSSFREFGHIAAEAIGGAFKASINSVLTTLENALNMIPSMINNALDLINRLPNVDIPNLPYFDLPRLADGGIVSRATRVIIGEGGESEAVIPLKTGLPQIAAAMARELKDQFDGITTQPQNVVYNFYQTNNSPKALSRWDIYRQTRNQLDFARGL